MRFQPRPKEASGGGRPSSIIALQGQLQEGVVSLGPLLLGLLLLLLRPPSAEGFSLPTSKLTSLSPQYPPPPDFGMQPHVKMTPRDFLAQRIPGPYTCLRARDRSLLGFDFHLARLLHSIQASGGQVGKEELRSMMLEAVENAVDEALSLRDNDDDQAAAKRKGPLESFITVHAALSGGGSSGQKGTRVSLSAHACAMPFAVPPPPVTLEVRGDGRREPEVKHSKWLWDRQELERFKVGAGGEVALSRPVAGGGREVLEGLVTNLFVFRKGDGALLTAGSGVLKGHVRQMVLGSARALGLDVREDEPLRLDEVHTWEEAFLTGSGRILAPIARVEGTSLGLSPVQLPTERPQTTLLRQRLLYDIDCAWAPLYELRGR